MSVYVSHGYSIVMPNYWSILNEPPDRFLLVIQQPDIIDVIYYPSACIVGQQSHCSLCSVAQPEGVHSPVRSVLQSLNLLLGRKVLTINSVE